MTDPSASPKAESEEFFDLYLRDGTPLGIRKERARVHRDGDWHRSIALWIVRRSGGMVFQERSASKDTWPGRLTASVSGHYAAGEALSDVLREANEELGVKARIPDLIRLGVWEHDQKPSPGIVDRELAEVFLWRIDLPLTSFHPCPAEVSGLVEIDAREFARLTADPLFMATGTRLNPDDHAVESVRVYRDRFVPSHEYHAHVARAALALTEGEAVVSW
jgi:isopentenyldiphosphate isomerase